MDARGEPQQGLERGHRGAPAVEPKGELVQVGLEVIVTDAVMGAPQPGLEVAKDSVDVRQELRRPLGGALGAGAMPVAHVRQRRVSPPAIRQNQGAERDRSLHESCQRARGRIRHGLEAHAPGGLTAHFDRAHHQRLLEELAAPLQACLWTAQVLATRIVIPESDLELLQRLGKVGPAHLATLSMGAFGVNPIGRMHLIQDATVPAHPRNDPHLTLTFGLGEPDERRIPLDSEPYEDWVMDTLRLQRSFFDALAGGTPPGGMSDLAAFTFSDTPVEGAPVPFTRLLDTGSYRMASNPAALTDTALVGIAEYTNGNYLSKDTVFQRFTHPAVSSLGPRSADLDLFVAQPGGGFRQYFAKETAGAPVRPFVMEGPLHSSLQAATGLPPGFGGWFLDDTIHQAYARKLLPRAVAYSTALLDYFFRGKLDVDVMPDAVDPTLVRIEGKNASPETLGGGTLSLYADVAVTDPAGVTRFVRQPATAVGSDLTVTAAPDAPVRSAPFQVPTQAERFVAVYKGPLGEERPSPDPAVENPGAVIGKVVGGLGVEHVLGDLY